MSDVIETRYVNGKGETARSTEKLRFLVTVSYDPFTTLSDFYEGVNVNETLPERTRKAYQDNEWHFVIVKVTPEVNAVDIDLPSYSSGVEWGSSPDWEEDADMNSICKHIVPDLIPEVHAELIKFRDILNAADLEINDNNTDQDA